MSIEDRKQIEEFAAAHFEAAERVKNLMMMNVPLDYDARKAAAIELAMAQAEEAFARKMLDEIIKG